MVNPMDKLSYAVIGHAMAVHRELGPGLDEIFYHELLVGHLQTDSIAHQSKPRGELRHCGLLADEFVPDLIADLALILELKALRGDFAPDHLMQIMCYEKFWRIPFGLLLDFGKESLVT